MKIKLTITNDKPIPQIGDQIWSTVDEYKIWGIVKSIKSVKRDERMQLNIIYDIRVTEKLFIGLRLIEGKENK